MEWNLLLKIETLRIGAVGKDGAARALTL